MIGFYGEFPSTMDAKGRFLLPAGVKKQLQEGEAGLFYINKGFETCLSLYPLKAWENVAEKMDDLDEFDAKRRKFLRVYLNGATPVEPDSAGRILVPSTHKEYAGLEKDIVVIGVGKKFEIWDSNKYKEIFESLSPQEFSDLAQEVLGNKGK